VLLKRSGVEELKKALDRCLVMKAMICREGNVQPQTIAAPGKDPLAH